MKIQSMGIHPYEISLKNGGMREGFLINLLDVKGNSSWGDVAPLPNWSHEGLEECLLQINQMKDAILEVNWITRTFLKDLMKFKFLPALLFGLESALLSLLIPLSTYDIPTSALFMGSPQEILH